MFFSSSSITFGSLLDLEPISLDIWTCRLSDDVCVYWNCCLCFNFHNDSLYIWKVFMKWFYFFKGPIVYISPNYSFQAAWAGQWLFSWLKQLEKNNWAWDMSSPSILSAWSWLKLKDINRGFAFSKCLNRALTWRED